ncbi:MAG: hypothetical protein LC641_13815, partial [Spirochaeta sp.]|nr:hypothetical protein [Spirochaeta sp.]
AGVYTAPVSLPLLAGFFEEHLSAATGSAGHGSVGHGGGNGNGGGGGNGNDNGKTVAGIDPGVLDSGGEAHRPAWIEAMEAFVSRYGAEFYELPLNPGHLRLERQPWTVPAEYHGVVPFYAGEELKFRALRED